MFTHTECLVKYSKILITWTLFGGISGYFSYFGVISGYCRTHLKWYVVGWVVSQSYSPGARAFSLCEKKTERLPKAHFDEFWCEYKSLQA